MPTYAQFCSALESLKTQSELVVFYERESNEKAEYQRQVRDETFRRLLNWAKTAATLPGTWEP